MGEKKEKPIGYKGTGRPSKYDSRYCDMLIGHMSEGKSFESFGWTIYQSTNGEERIARETLYLWAKEHEEFMHAKKLGQDARLHWHEVALNGISAGTIKGNPAPSMFTLKCAEPLLHTEKQVIEHQGETKTAIDMRNLETQDLIAIAGIISKQKVRNE